MFLDLVASATHSSVFSYLNTIENLDPNISLLAEWQLSFLFHLKKNQSIKRVISDKPQIYSSKATEERHLVVIRLQFLAIVLE